MRLGSGKSCGGKGHTHEGREPRRLRVGRNQVVRQSRGLARVLAGDFILNLLNLIEVASQALASYREVGNGAGDVEFNMIFFAPPGEVRAHSRLVTVAVNSRHGFSAVGAMSLAGAKVSSV